jgi:hypothetical protein
MIREFLKCHKIFLRRRPFLGENERAAPTPIKLESKQYFTFNSKMFCCFSSGTVVEPSKKMPVPMPVQVNTVVRTLPTTVPRPVQVNTVVRTLPTTTPLPPVSPSSTVPSAPSAPSVPSAPTVKEEDEYADMPLLVSVDDIPNYPEIDHVFNHFVNTFESINCTATKCNDRLYIKYISHNGSLDIVVYIVGNTKFISLNDCSVELDVFNQISNVEYLFLESPPMTNIVFKNSTFMHVSCPMNMVVRALSDNLYNKEYEEEEEYVEEQNEQTHEHETNLETLEKNYTVHKGIVYLVSLAIMGMSLAIPYNINK